MSDLIFDFYFFKTSMNTNDEVKKINKYSKKKNNIALFSLKQIKGRGRINKKWISEKGDLTCSYFINKDFKINDLGNINLWFTFILLSSLRRKFPKKKFKIKWPNDIYIENKKLAGVLIETNIVKNKIKSLIIGLGINFVSSPNNLDYETISVNSFSKEVNPISFFVYFTKEISDSLCIFKKTNIDKKDKNFLQNFKDFGKSINIKKNGEIIKGIFYGLGDNGEIILKKNDKLHLISYGDIV